mgnify:CR=1 FL=1
MTNHWKLLAATHLAAGLTGWMTAPRELLAENVVSNGLFETDRLRVLTATVLSLRAENKLLVYTFKGSAAVSVERSKLWVLTGRQDLIIPALVSYYVDLSKLTVNDVSYDEVKGVITVTLPPLVMGDVAFQAEAARTFNGGLLTFDQDQVDELSRLNYLNARRAFIKQAQGVTLLAAARAEAERSIAAAFTVPLRALGRPDVRVLVRFAN